MHNKGMLFDWDADKAAENEAKHGITFEEATKAFYDMNAIEEYDEEHSITEERYRLIGLVGRGLLTVVYTERSGIYWMITARKATGVEEEIYEESQKGW